VKEPVIVKETIQKPVVGETVVEEPTTVAETTGLKQPVVTETQPIIVVDSPAAKQPATQVEAQ
jgi:hypothetical protein